MASKKTVKKKSKKAAATSSKTPAKKASSKKPAKKASSKKPAKKASSKKTAKKAAKKTASKKTAKKKATKKKAKARVQGTRHEPSVFLLVHLPASLSPMERFERFEEPIDDALRGADEAGLGEVTGGGSSLDDGGNVVSCDIEVEVHDVARCLPILRRVLKESGAPTGTVVTRLAPDGAFEVLDQL